MINSNINLDTESNLGFWDKNIANGCLDFYLDKDSCSKCISPCNHSQMPFFSNPLVDEVFIPSIPTLPPFIPRIPPRPAKIVRYLVSKDYTKRFHYSALFSMNKWVNKYLDREASLKFIDHFTRDRSLILEWTPEKTLDFLHQNSGISLVFSPELGHPKASMPYRIRGVWNFSINTYLALIQFAPVILSVPSTASIKHVEPYFPRIMDLLELKYIAIYLGSCFPAEFESFIEVIEYYLTEYPDLHLTVAGISSPSRITELIGHGVKSILTQDWGYYTTRIFTAEGWYRSKKLELTRCECEICDYITSLNDPSISSTEIIVLHNLFSLEKFINDCMRCE